MSAISGVKGTNTVSSTSKASPATVGEVDTSELVQLAKDMHVVQSEVDHLRDKVEDALEQAIARWTEVEPPTCGLGGGWKFEHLDQEGEYVVLKHGFNPIMGHECTTRVALHDLLGQAPKVEVQEVTLTSERPCKNCGSDLVEWLGTVRTTPHAPGHNLLSLHDVEAIAVLGCVDCSETLAVVPLEQLVLSLTQELTNALGKTWAI